MLVWSESQHELYSESFAPGQVASCASPPSSPLHSLLGPHTLLAGFHSLLCMQMYARQVRCLFCGCEGAQLEGHPVSCCAGRQQQPDMCEEDLSCRQYMAVSPQSLVPQPLSAPAYSPQVPRELDAPALRNARHSQCQCTAVQICCLAPTLLVRSIAGLQGALQQVHV